MLASTTRVEKRRLRFTEVCDVAQLYSAKLSKPLRLKLSTVFLTKNKGRLRGQLLIRDYDGVKPLGFTKLPFTSAICLKDPVITVSVALDTACIFSLALANITKSNNILAG